LRFENASQARGTGSTTGMNSNLQAAAKKMVAERNKHRPLKAADPNVPLAQAARYGIGAKVSVFKLPAAGRKKREIIEVMQFPSAHRLKVVN
jgi:hypothetical protein